MPVKSIDVRFDRINGNLINHKERLSDLEERISVLERKLLKASDSDISTILGLKKKDLLGLG